MLGLVVCILVLIGLASRVSQSGLRTHRYTLLEDAPPIQGITSVSQELATEMTRVAKQTTILFDRGDLPKSNAKSWMCLQVWDALPENTILWYSETKPSVDSFLHSGLVLGTRSKQGNLKNEAVFEAMNVSWVASKNLCKLRSDQFYVRKNRRNAQFFNEWHNFSEKTGDEDLVFSLLAYKQELDIVWPQIT